ncbi:hypothetical protein FFWV33_00315 [Flavobacterium faecale]|uniref:Anti-sigma factor n=1 Tax=Flavobacterium faecale TaxID=1355330 RepID=A0A2S1L8J6_9FLAO|nr:hypothetical protein [Flavobacterium faecale]AWG20070.1 hypothetical protein FFWV33_00315 [Flavobacterium faecale]
MEKDKWIEEVMDTANQIVEVAPADGLYFQIQQKLNAKKKVRKEVLWLAAASIVILASINIKVIYSDLQVEHEIEETALVASVSDSNQFYFR